MHSLRTMYTPYAMAVGIAGREYQGLVTSTVSPRFLI